MHKNRAEQQQLYNYRQNSRGVLQSSRMCSTGGLLIRRCLSTARRRIVAKAPIEIVGRRMSLHTAALRIDTSRLIAVVFMVRHRTLPTGSRVSLVTDQILWAFVSGSEHVRCAFICVLYSCRLNQNIQTHEQKPH